MARPNKINANQFRNSQQAKLTQSGLAAKFAAKAIERLDNALQAADEDNLPIGTEITRTYTSLEPDVVISLAGTPQEEKATKALANVVLAAVKQLIVDEFGRRGFTVVFVDSGDTHFVTIS